MMSSKLKSIFLLAATLLIGLIAGASITGAIVRERLSYVRSFANAEGFATRFTELIEPLTQEQRTAVEPILQAAGGQIEARFQASGRQVFAVIEQLEQDLGGVLSQEQMKKLRAQRAKLRKRYVGQYTIATKEDLSD
jgi:NH3-dependent NAD+ synthetase